MGILGPSGLFFVYFMFDFISFNIYYFQFTPPLIFYVLLQPSQELLRIYFSTTYNKTQSINEKDSIFIHLTLCLLRNGLGTGNYCDRN